SAAASGAEPPARAPTMRVATRIVPPFVFEEGGQLTGFSVDLWRALADKMGVTSEFQVKPALPDLFAAVKGGGADVGIAAISITAERDRDFDFSQPMFEAGLTILVRGQAAEEAASNPIHGLFRLLLSRTMLMWLGVVV